MTLKFDGWPWKTIRQFFYVTSSFVHHFIAIDEFKLKLQSGNTQFRSKLTIFVQCDLKIWWMTLKNNRAPLLCYFKLCASYVSHRWIHSRVAVRKFSIWVKIGFSLLSVTLKFERWPWKTIGDLSYATSSFSSFNHFIAISEFKLEFLSCVTLKFDRWPCNIIGHLFYVTSSFMNHFIAIDEFKFKSDLCDLDLWPLTLTLRMDIVFVNSNNSWKFYDDMMRGTLWKRCKRQTHRRKNREMDRRREEFLELLGHS